MGGFTPPFQKERHMNFNVDSYIELGNGHNICEDYALEGKFGDGELAYVIISDGCTSSPKTDLGSRIISFSAEKAIKNAYHGSLIENLSLEQLVACIKMDIIFYSKNTVAQFGLSYQICDATLLMAIATKGKYFIIGYGDGNIIIKRTNGTSAWFNINYASNAPYYLSYEMDVLRKHSYMDDEKFGGAERTVNLRTYKDTGYLSNIITTESTAPLIHTGDIKKIDFISLSSDGIETYEFNPKKLEEPTPEEKNFITTPEVAFNTVAYKKTHGKFVRRRMDRLKLEMEKIQAQHFDDISSATLKVNHAS